MSSWWIISPITEMGNGELKIVNSFWDAFTLREPSNVWAFESGLMEENDGL